MLIQLNKGVQIRIDAADKKKVEAYTWRFDGRYAYSWCRKRKRHIFLHRFLRGFPKGKTVDHVNGDKLDNRRANLRIATHSQQSANKRVNKNNKLKLKGVSPTGKYFRALLFKEGKYILNAYFKDPITAARAYDKAAKKAYGKFARLNNV